MKDKEFDQLLQDSVRLYGHEYIEAPQESVPAHSFPDDFIRDIPLHPKKKAPVIRYVRIFSAVAAVAVIAAAVLTIPQIFNRSQRTVPQTDLDSPSVSRQVSEEHHTPSDAIISSSDSKSVRQETASSSGTPLPDRQAEATPDSDELHFAWEMPVQGETAQPSTQIPSSNSGKSLTSAEQTPQQEEPTIPETIQVTPEQTDTAPAEVPDHTAAEPAEIPDYTAAEPAETPDYSAAKPADIPSSWGGTKMFGDVGAILPQREIAALQPLLADCMKPAYRTDDIPDSMSDQALLILKLYASDEENPIPLNNRLYTEVELVLSPNGMGLTANTEEDEDCYLIPADDPAFKYLCLYYALSL